MPIRDKDHGKQEKHDKNIVNKWIREGFIVTPAPEGSDVVEIALPAPAPADTIVVYRVHTFLAPEPVPPEPDEAA